MSGDARGGNDSLIAKALPVLSFGDAFACPATPAAATTSLTATGDFDSSTATPIEMYDNARGGNDRLTATG